MRLLAILLLCAILWPIAARAEELIGFYRASWAGLPAATIRLQLTGSADAYRDRIAIETEGLPRWVTKFRADATSEGALGEPGAAPTRYDALYDLRKRKHSHISLRYVAGERATIAERTAEDTSRKPALPEAYRRDVIDPLAAAAAIRQHLRQGLPHVGEHFTLPVYDGARRFDVAAAVIAIGGKDKAIRLRLELRPIAGFKGESSDDQDPDDAPRPVEISFSDDDRLMPLALRAPIFFLPLTVQLDHVCPSFDACAPKEK